MVELITARSFQAVNFEDRVCSRSGAYERVRQLEWATAIVFVALQLVVWCLEACGCVGSERDGKVALFKRSGKKIQLSGGEDRGWGRLML